MKTRCLFPILLLVSHTLAAPKPNFLLILAADLGCFGSEIETPNLDQLAETGLRCTRMYSTGRCRPSRGALMSGLDPHRPFASGNNAVPLENQPWELYKMPEDRIEQNDIAKTMPERLKDLTDTHHADEVGFLDIRENGLRANRRQI